MGRKVAARLNNVEATGVEIVATLEALRDDGIVLSEVGELGPGPTVFCPWGSLHRIRERPPWLPPPHEESEEEGYVEIGEAQVEEAGPQPPVERRREPSARTLERVVPVAQKQSVADVTVALTSLELYGAGVGILRWRLSLGGEALQDEPGFGFGIPEPVFEIRDGVGRPLPWSPRGGGASDGESDGEIEVRELPEAGDLRIEVARLAADAYGPEGDHLGEGPSLYGPWSFRFAV